MPEVIFDSSFLMAVVERPTTWFEDMTESLGRFDPIVLDCVSGELGRLASGEGKKARVARVALELARGFKQAKCAGNEPDDEIVSAALGRKASVATADGSLTRTLESLHVKVIRLRSGRVIV